jgi:hypothetical protein
VPKRSRKLPMAPAPNWVDLDISDADWQRIERTSYGRPLSDAVRKDVLEVTQEFAYFEVVERTAERLGDAEAIVKACKKAASDFQRTLLDQAFKSSDAGDYARQLIKKNFHDARLSIDGRPLETLSGLLTSFGGACNLALRDLQDAPSFREGAARHLWFLRLIQIMEDYGLSASVRKDAGGKSKSDKQSPFVLFVRELQYCLPDACRCSMQSDSALAKAIAEARAKTGRINRSSLF